MEELLKKFNLSESFFFSFSGDLTNSLQRQTSQVQKDAAEKPLWQRVDDRFFFNKHLLRDLIALETPGADQFILPCIQGYLEIRTCPLADHADGSFQEPMLMNKSMDGLPDFYTVALISRRSRHRAGQ